MAWSDEGQELYEFGFVVGDSEDKETHVISQDGNVCVIMTRSALDKLILILKPAEEEPGLVEYAPPPSE